MADDQSLEEKLAALSRSASEYWQVMVRFFVLANAGSAVAVLSFLGASSNANPGAWLALVPLGFFFTGMVSAGIAAIGQAGLHLYNVTLVANKFVGKKATIPKGTELVMALRRASPWAELFAFASFILGGISGLVFLGILLTASDGTAPAPSAAVLG